MPVFSQVALLFVFSAIVAGHGSAQVRTDGLCARQTQVARTRCAKQEYDAAQAALWRAFRAALAQSTGEVQQRLLTAQGKFLEYQEAQCAFVAASVSRDSAESTRVFRCLAELDRQRIQQLRWRERARGYHRSSDER